MGSEGATWGHYRCGVRTINHLTSELGKEPPPIFRWDRDDIQEIFTNQVLGVGGPAHQLGLLYMSDYMALEMLSARQLLALREGLIEAYDRAAEEPIWNDYDTFLYLQYVPLPDARTSGGHRSHRDSLKVLLSKVRRLFEERGAQLKYPLAYSEVSEEEKDCRAIVIGCAALAFPNVRMEWLMKMLRKCIRRVAEAAGEHAPRRAWKAAETVWWNDVETPRHFEEQRELGAAKQADEARKGKPSWRVGPINPVRFAQRIEEERERAREEEQRASAWDGRSDGSRSRSRSVSSVGSEDRREGRAATRGRSPSDDEWVWGGDEDRERGRGPERRGGYSDDGAMRERDRSWRDDRARGHNGERGGGGRGQDEMDWDEERGASENEGMEWGGSRGRSRERGSHGESRNLGRGREREREQDREREREREGERERERERKERERERERQERQERKALRRKENRRKYKQRKRAKKREREAAAEKHFFERQRKRGRGWDDSDGDNPLAARPKRRVRY